MSLPAWNVISRREREAGATLVDVTSDGAARGRKRHERFRFDLMYEHMPPEEAAAVQAYCVTNEGLLVQITWRDGITYEGLLAEWVFDRGESPLQSAQVIIRGAVAQV